MRRNLLAITIVVIVLSLTGCGHSEPAATAAPTARSAAPSPSPDPLADAPTCAKGLPLVVLSPPGVPASFALPAGDTGTTGVVLLHQSNGNVCQLAEYAQHLAGLGYRAIAVELPRNPMAAYAAEGVAWLRQHGSKRVFILGTSMGGTVAVAAAARVVPPVDGLISLSAPKEWWDIDAPAEAAKLRMPVLIAAGQNDRDFAAAAQLISSKCGSRRTTLMIVPKTSAHGVALLDILGPQIEAFLRSR